VENAVIPALLKLLKISIQCVTVAVFLQAESDVRLLVGADVGGFVVGLLLFWFPLSLPEPGGPGGGSLLGGGGGGLPEPGGPGTGSPLGGGGNPRPPPPLSS